MKRPPSARKSPPKKRGARKATRQSVHSEKQISAMCTRFRLEGTPAPVLTFRDLRDRLNAKYGVKMSVGTVYRMAHGEEPASIPLRRALGLSVAIPTPACPMCGVVHTKPCPRTSQHQSAVYPNLFSWPVKLLAKAIRNRR